MSKWATRPYFIKGASDWGKCALIAQACMLFAGEQMLSILLISTNLTGQISYHLSVCMCCISILTPERVRFSLNSRQKCSNKEKINLLHKLLTKKLQWSSVAPEISIITLLSGCIFRAATFPFPGSRVKKAGSCKKNTWSPFHAAF